MCLHLSFQSSVAAEEMLHAKTCTGWVEFVSKLAAGLPKPIIVKCLSMDTLCMMLWGQNLNFVVKKQTVIINKDLALKDSTQLNESESSTEFYPKLSTERSAERGVFSSTFCSTFSST